MSRAGRREGERAPSARRACARALRILPWPPSGPALALSLVLSLSLVAAPRTLVAQAPRIFDRLEGSWEGEGILMGRTAHFSMSWERYRDFAILTFANAFAGAGGERTPVLSSAAVYRTGARSPQAVWLDSRGVEIEIRWEATDSTLLAHWTAPTESGRTTYRVRAADTLEVTDEVQGESGMRVFGRATLLRASGRPSGL